MAPPKRPPLERFLEKVVHDAQAGCWVWSGGRIHEGYGVFWLGGKTLRAHRWAYETFVGPIPEGLVLDHLCRRPECVNPEHLEPVTQSVNINRGVLWEKEKTHCSRGHAYDEVNTYIDPDGHRHCRACRRERKRKNYREHHWQGNAHPRDRTHCPHGHEYTEENTYRPPSGARVCRACMQKNVRAWWAENGREWRRGRRARGLKN